MYGIDISHHQGYSLDVSQYEFVIMKASEGVGWKDSKLDHWYNQIHGSKDGKPDENKCYGFYHYARPETGNSPKDEADWFLSLVGHHAGYAFMALDWEGKALNEPIEWAINWLNRVYEITGVKPGIYVQESAIKTGAYKEIAELGFPLWVAKWSSAEPSLSASGWNQYTIWQYQGSPLDSNIFNGSKEDWKNMVSGKEVEKKSIQIQEGQFIEVSNDIGTCWIGGTVTVIDGSHLIVDLKKG